MIWLDYDYDFNESVRDDLRSAIENAPTNSILIVTVNGLDKKYAGKPIERPERLRSLFGALVPDDLAMADCKGEKMQKTLADFGLDFMKSVAADMARPGGFVPAFRIVYEDGPPMVTIGGVLPAKADFSAAKEAVGAANWPAWPTLAIRAPHLTMREAAVLQSRLPGATKLTREKVKELGFDLEDGQIEVFETYYREYPAFAQVVAS